MKRMLVGLLIGVVIGYCVPAILFILIKPEGILSSACIGFFPCLLIISYLLGLYAMSD